MITVHEWTVITHYTLGACPWLLVGALVVWAKGVRR